MRYGCASSLSLWFSNRILVSALSPLRAVRHFTSLVVWPGGSGVPDFAFKANESQSTEAKDRGRQRRKWILGAEKASRASLLRRAVRNTATQRLRLAGRTHSLCDWRSNPASLTTPTLETVPSGCASTSRRSAFHGSLRTGPDRFAALPASLTDQPPHPCSGARHGVARPCPGVRPVRRDIESRRKCTRSHPRFAASDVIRISSSTYFAKTSGPKTCRISMVSPSSAGQRCTHFTTSSLDGASTSQ